MRILILIIFIFTLPNISFSQVDSFLLYTGNEKEVLNYEIQKSVDSTDNSKWVTVTQLIPLEKDSNVYAYPIIDNNYYFRVIANMVGNNTFKSRPLLLISSTLGINIVNIYAQYSTYYSTVYWTALDESSIKYYKISNSYDGKNFTQVAIVNAGTSQYRLQVNRPVITTYKGWWWWKKKITTIDSRKMIFQLNVVTIDGIESTIKIFSE